MGIFSRKKKASVSLVFDVRDASVSVAAVRFAPEKKPQILLCENTPIDIKDPKDGEAAAEAMLRALDQGQLAVRKGLARTGTLEPIDGYFFFLGSPWSAAEAKLIRIVKDRPFEITKEILSRAVSGEEASAEHSLERRARRPWRLLEEKIVRFKLDGYPVGDIFGKKARRAEIELFVSFVPASIESRLAALLEKDASAEKRMNSSAIAAYSYFRDGWPDAHEFLFADIGRHVTEIFIVKDGVIDALASFPFGEQKLIEAIGRGMGVPEPMAYSAVSAHCAGECDVETEKKIRELIARGAKTWIEKLSASLRRISNETDLPKDAFLVERGAVMKALIREIGAPDAFELLGKRIAVHTVSEQPLDALVENGKAFANEPYLKMDLAFLEKTAGIR